MPLLLQHAAVASLAFSSSVSSFSQSLSIFKPTIRYNFVPRPFGTRLSFPVTFSFGNICFQLDAVFITYLCRVERLIWVKPQRAVRRSEAYLIVSFHAFLEENLHLSKQSISKSIEKVQNLVMILDVLYKN